MAPKLEIKCRQIVDHEPLKAQIYFDIIPKNLTFTYIHNERLLRSSYKPSLNELKRKENVPRSTIKLYIKGCSAIKIRDIGYSFPVIVS